jgi:hypothetical protein
MASHAKAFGLFTLVLSVLHAPLEAYSQNTAPREVNITTDSAPGWIPSVELEKNAVATLRRYLSEKDAGNSVKAYAFMTAINQRDMPLGRYKADNEQFLTKSGSVIERRIIKLTWTKDPAQAPFPGIYAAIDIASRFERIDRHCGYIVLYQVPTGGPFQVMREESNFITNQDAAAIAKKQTQAGLDGIWARLSSNCPNYSTAPAKP